MSDIFLDEYTADAALLKYRRETAGHGVSYLLEHDYGAIYKEVLQKTLESSRRKGVRLLEFGCGAGMNLIHVASMVERLAIPLDCAYGTDFSGKLIEAARSDAARYLKPAVREKVQFLVARNEAIIDDVASGLNVTKDTLRGSFDMVLGVNTFRYCYRIDKENESAKQLFDLLDNGGVTVMIDMNAQFRFFRSRLRRTKQVQDKQFYIPVLEEYVRPFEAAGFKILDARNFCWVPHSAGPALLAICRMLSPVLDLAASRFAIRSLVIAKKPL
jgi:SAM-dependent methyltransferase